MRRYFNLILVMVVSMLAVSCNDDMFSEGSEGRTPLTFNASLGSSATSRTTLDGVQVKWEQTDKVDLWYGTLGTEMTQADYEVGTIDAEDARQATLNGFAVESPAYMACYPASSSNDCSKKGKITTVMPVKQSAVAGSFVSGANVSVAYSTTTDLSFNNIGALLALKVNSTGGHTIKNIRLTGTSALTGEVEIKQAALPAIDAVTEGINFVMLDCGDGIKEACNVNGSSESYSEETGIWSAAKAETRSVLLSGDNIYYMVVLPGSHTGIVMTFVDSVGKTAVQKKEMDASIARNSNTLVGVFDITDDMFKSDEKVYINEIFCHGDQIELYNPGGSAVDLSGYYFQKDDDKFWAIPYGTVIPANGYIVFTGGQEDCSLGPTFGISGDKGFDLKLCNGTVVDEIANTGDTLVVIGETETYGRKTDGSAEWVVFSQGTIYENGVCDGDNSKGTIRPVASDPIVLNEINGNDKYIELYNPTGADVSLNGWTLYKDSSLVWTGSAENSIPANGYLVIYSSKISITPVGAPVFSGGISAKKSLQVILKDASSNDKDIYTRGEDFGNITLTENTSASFSRVPNATGDWKYAAPTCGIANGEKTGVIEQYPAANGNVVLNELDGNNKFIELYNTSTDNKISLEEYTLYKDDESDTIWTGAQGLYIAPGGYVLLYSTDVKSSHTDHDSNLFFDSGLSPKKSVKIELKNADATSLDIFTRGASPWGTKISEQSNSFGRTPDGTGSWYLMTTSTPGAGNSTSAGDIPQD